MCVWFWVRFCGVFSDCRKNVKIICLYELVLYILTHYISLIV